MQFEPLSEEYVTKLAASDEVVTRHFVSYFGNLMAIKLRAKRLPPSAIDEIRQETFARVLSAVRREGIRDGRKLGAYLNTTCNHVVSEHFRQTGRYAPLEDAHFERITEEVDAETKILSRERQRQVHVVLDTLTERDRRLLQALFFDEMDKDVVCEEFGVDRGYLRVLLHRAKIAFRGRFQQ
ncbi:MAG: sigma-70 family RNA polymerase sigma factor [Bryobacterales bacterium]|nr:sigma-70 family RNA polymerase sigma factor [Bryobacterales bacterium]